MPKDAVNARIFYKILHLIETLINGQNVFAYNDFSFDFHILNETLKYYKLSISEYCNFVKKI
jgi:DNA polymerase-3 subunit epsilon